MGHLFGLDVDLGDAVDQVVRGVGDIIAAGELEPIPLQFRDTRAPGETEGEARAGTEGDTGGAATAAAAGGEAINNSTNNNTVDEL